MIVLYITRYTLLRIDPRKLQQISVQRGRGIARMVRNCCDALNMLVRIGY